MIRRLIARVPGVAAAYHVARLRPARMWFWRDFRRFLQLSVAQPRGGLGASVVDLYPCLEDRTPATGFEPHYTYHTAWAARVLAQTRPAQHIDIGSSLLFIGVVSAFVPVDFYDYRPANCQLSGLRPAAADLLDLPFPDRTVSSLSCLHVAEHVGLGRYGDPLDPDGDLKAMAELQRVLAPGGDLLFVVPVGRPRVCFNAHRIYAYRHVLAGFPELRLHQFALIPDDYSGGIVGGADERLVDAQEWGCGCFWFKREAV